MSEVQGNFRQDGVMFIPGALSAPTLALAEAAYQWSLDHPGPGANALPSKGSGEFYQDLANPAALDAYADLISQPDIARIISGAWGKTDVWFMYEQVFRKAGGTTRRTPWHQDTPYLPVEGEDLAVMWISFDSVPAENALEFVSGSHRSTLYDGSMFAEDDDTRPLYGDGSLPRLPDIEADRAAWPIVSWPTEPGDVIVFHPAILHGGGDTDDQFERRTLSLRFFGEDAVVAGRPGRRRGSIEQPDSGKEVHPLTRMRFAEPGAPFRDAAFPRLSA